MADLPHMLTLDPSNDQLHPQYIAILPEEEPIVSRVILKTQSYFGLWSIWVNNR